MNNTIDKFYMEEIELCSKDPMDIFKSWFLDAKNQKDNVLPEQLTLATIDKEGNPTARTLLLRGYDKEGFKLYWDNRSKKTEELQNNPHAAIVFVWFFRDKQDNLGYKQVRVEGVMERLSEAEEVAYFDSEPIASKIRAAICVQSRVIEDRKLLLEGSQQLLDKVKMSGIEISKPDHYAGHRLMPTSIEFYKGSRDTINDRVRFRLAEDNCSIDLPSGTFHGSNGWVYERLEP